MQEYKNKYMKIRFFKHGIGNSWELNFIGKKYNLRIAKHQIAFWKNNEAIFNFLNTERSDYA